jgi:UDP-N-acetylglucosamine/UDP-N-acetylgalactosamine diphosphorylase
METEESFKKLCSLGQQHIFKDFEKLTAFQQKQLIEQVHSINIPMFRKQQQLLLKHSDQTHPFIDVFDKITFSGNTENYLKGRKLINEGKVGCLIVAGGMGTRLGFNGPKGMLPISIIQKKTLFQLFAEKTRAASNQAKRCLPLAIMTSPFNHQDTLNYFEENNYFGLEKENIDFFSQEMLPLLDHAGNLFLDKTNHIAVGPDGNGSALQHFVKNGIWKKWHAKGVRYLNFILIDNLLANPFDSELVGFHESQGVDIVVKCISRQDPKENVGILVKKDDKSWVIEYSELPEEEKTAKSYDGSLKHPAANLSLFSFSMDFISKLTKEPLPLHLAHKAAEFLNDKEATEKTPNAWKFEEFIFDLLPLASSVKALLYPREECFAPLKNEKGNDNSKHYRH